MKLADALRVLRDPPAGGAAPLRAYLACGFTPLHLATFLAAHLRLLSGRSVDLQYGLYGDCLGNVERAAQAAPDALVVALEWADFDPRLGLRQLGGWDPGRLDDIVSTVERRAARLRTALEQAAAAAPVALSLPSLPLPPVSYTTGWQSGSIEPALLEISAQLGRALAANPRIRLASRQRLDALSAPTDRLDVRAELSSGFPYRTTHASSLAEVLARLVHPPAAKKGLILDLDDVLWSGIVGEAGVDGVSWDLDGGSQMHGILQQLVRALAQAGVLVAVASKNDPARVAEALRRQDLLLEPKHLFPVEVHWGPKSDSVRRILRAWNVAADSVVFLDDSPMELAEVAAAYPACTCLRFPPEDEDAAYRLLGELRDLFGKSRLSAEDAIRLESVRGGAQWAAGTAARGEGARGASGDFLAEAGAALTVSFDSAPLDPRALELVNKTNQFNLNGRRCTEAAWDAYVRSPDRFVAVVAYRDKYGPLGRIAVIGGRAYAGTVAVDTWVMSCRAFARRIEHRCVEILFDRFGVDEIVFDFQATERNGPVREFFDGVAAQATGGRFRLKRSAFAAACPPLFHCVELEALEPR